MQNSKRRPVASPPDRDLDKIHLSPLAKELMHQPEAQPYLAYTEAVLTAKDTRPALEQIRALPCGQRYTSRIVGALDLAFADFDSQSIKADKKVLTDLQWETLVGRDLALRPIQFCMFLKALFGGEEMERVMNDAISYARRCR